MAEEQSSSGVPTYRILMIELLRYALNAGKVLNWSSGVSEFKLLRGASPVVEMMAVRSSTPLHKLVYFIFSFVLGKIMISDRAHSILRT